MSISVDQLRQRIQLILEEAQEAQEAKVYRTLRDLDDEFMYALERDMGKSNNLTAKYLFDAIELYKDGEIKSKHDLFQKLNLPMRPSDKYAALTAFLKKIKSRYRFYVFDDLPLRSTVKYRPTRTYETMEDVDDALMSGLRQDGSTLAFLLFRAIEIHRAKPFKSREDMIIRLNLDKSSVDAVKYMDVILWNWRHKLKVSIFDSVKNERPVSKEKQFVELILKYPHLQPTQIALKLGTKVSAIPVFLSRAKRRGDIPSDFKMARQDYGTLTPESGLKRYG